MFWLWIMGATIPLLLLFWLAVYLWAKRQERKFNESLSVSSDWSDHY
jgi:hypothetical protein